jgi:fibronectin type 3 domain-containing protein
MHRLTRTATPPPRARRRRARLQLEALESRITPAVVGVNAASNVHPIDPNIYGTAFATTAQLADLHVPLNRDGGNASDTYSYPQDATNHGSDWYFESIPSGGGNGQGMDSFVNTTKAGGAQPSITLNLFDWAAKVGAGRSDLGSFSVTKYGPQQATDPYHSDWGNGVHTDGTNVTGNDPNDAYVPNSPAIEQAWIQHLIATFGNSQNGGVKYYTLGNETGLWNSTHRDIYPNGDTLPDLLNRIIGYATMVKTLDPGAQILGPEEWGWTNYFISGADSTAHNWGATYDGLNAEAWLLNQLRQHDAATGQRLLDYFTLHFYPQGGQFGNDVSTNMELLRNRSTRSLWDPNYVDESWIGTTGINGGKVELINLMKDWVNTYYPGTKIGITEYNWGAEGNMNGATTQADIWGIFGREGLDLADRWTTPATGSPTYLAMKMFRNYDGNGSAFGDSSVSASVANPDQVDAFSSIRSSDGALTVMVINKNLYDPANPSATTPITLNLSNFNAAATAQEWQLAATNPGDQTVAQIRQLADAPIAGGNLTVSVPMESVTLFVIKPGATAPPAPTGLSATPSDGRVALSWNAVAGATSYDVYRGTSSGGETLLQSGVAGTTFADTAVTDGTTYYYTVSAVNAAGEGPHSTEVSATPQVGAPAAPTGLTATPGVVKVSLSWSPVGGATSYNVYRGTTSGAETLYRSGVTATTYTDTSVTGGTTYDYEVTAVNAGGESPRSAEVSATPQVAPPAAPTGLSATASDGRVALAWSAAAGATSYNVYRSTTSGAEALWQSGVAATTYTDTGVTNGTTYHYMVSAVNAGGESPRSAEVSARPQVAAPTAPTNLHVTAVTPTQISLAWTELSTNLTGFLLERATNSTFTAGLTSVNLGAAARSYIATGLAPGTGYWFRMRAANAGGVSAYSNVAAATTPWPLGTGRGLAATYFNNPNLTGTTVRRIDPVVNFNWGTGSPVPGIAPFTFSVLWTGQVQAIEPGIYRFLTVSEDGVRLWINGRLLINDWKDHRPTIDTSPAVALAAGQKASIALAYYQDTGSAVIRLLWQRPGQTTFGVIPPSQLYPPSPPAVLVHGASFGPSTASLAPTRPSFEDASFTDASVVVIGPAVVQDMSVASHPRSRSRSAQIPANPGASG